jgi:SAM-dependent methyltransferase
MTMSDLPGWVALRPGEESPVTPQAEARIEPPLPPAEFRRLVCHDDSLFDLPHPGTLVFPRVAPELYRSVFDFGCGCGRIARQLLVQQPRPRRYDGIDIHRGMIGWCQANLSTLDSAFRFHHHDVWNLGLAPENTRQTTLPFPVPSHEYSFVIAHSVFTHLYKEQTAYYLREVARILTDDGVARTTWFLFDRTTFPMLFDFQVNLFINECDPTNAVIYDWQFLLDLFRELGLHPTHTIPPAIRGHQWEVYLTKSVEESGPCDFPGDAVTRLSMCGTGIGAGHAPAREQKSPTTHLLRCTGQLAPEEFDARCSELKSWPQSFYFDNGLSVRGDYDAGADIAAYGFPESMDDLRVLDVGTRAGWFAFYFEQMGAEVVTIDGCGYADLDSYRRLAHPPDERDKRPPDSVAEDGTPIYFSPENRGFWIMKEILRSKARFHDCRIYDISPALFGGNKFDLVFLGDILGRLRDPIGALMAVRTVCRHRVIASAPVEPGKADANTRPGQVLAYTGRDGIIWWLPDEACFKHWFLAAGFTGVEVSARVTLRADSSANENKVLRIGSAFAP